VAAKRVGDEITTHGRAWNTAAWCKSATASFVLGTFDRVVEAQHVRTEIHTPRTNYQPLQTLTFFFALATMALVMYSTRSRSEHMGSASPLCS